MTALDKVLAALDAGLQSSDEQGYPERIDDVTKCARCLRHEHAADAELCSGCRGYLLGDSDEDPARTEPLGWLTDYAIDRPTMADANARMYLQNPQRVRMMRLDAEGRPTGDSHELAGYAIHHRNGNALDNSPENLELVPASENVARPAACRVASSIAVPEWYHVTCDRCGAGYACDPERTEAAAAIMRNDGHGRDGTCTLGLNDAAVAEMREDALRRLAVGLDLPPELLSDLSANPAPYDWQREREDSARMMRRW